MTALKQFNSGRLRAIVQGWRRSHRTTSTHKNSRNHSKDGNTYSFMAIWLNEDRGFNSARWVFRYSSNGIIIVFYPCLQYRLHPHPPTHPSSSLFVGPGISLDRRRNQTLTDGSLSNAKEAEDEDFGMAHINWLCYLPEFNSIQWINQQVWWLVWV